MLPDYLEHSFQVREHLIIPEPQHLKPIPAKAFVPAFIIATIIGMLAAVKLDYKPRNERQEISDVLFYGLLAPKLHALNLTQSQVSPKQGFGICGVVAEVTGIRD